MPCCWLWERPLCLDLFQATARRLIMFTGNLELFAPLLVFLMAALVSDLRRHIIPNALVLIGLLAGLLFRLDYIGVGGLVHGFGGVFLGFLLFLPFYVLGGMAGGDVKLMAMVGAFLGPDETLLAVACTLVFGGVCGFLIVLYHRQFLVTAKRYWLMLISHTYFAPATDEAAALRFPYSIAVCLGTLSSGLWVLLSNSGV